MEIVDHRSQSRCSPRNASTPLSQSRLAGTRITHATLQHVCGESEASRTTAGTHPTNKKLITLWQFVWLGSYCKVRKVLGPGILARLLGVSHCEKKALPMGLFFFFFRCSALSFSGQRLLEKVTLITSAAKVNGTGGCTNSPYSKMRYEDLSV